ncbi:MAG: hypothetical protein Q4G39_08185, partial [Brachymonas sp.]|nr:hypothetical protein [Brachymonas sp.]
MASPAASHAVARPWQDWLVSLLVHAVVLGAAWFFLHHAPPEPEYVALDTPIAWVATDDTAGGGGGGGGGGGVGDGKLGGGGGGGDGTELLKADGAGAPDTATPAADTAPATPAGSGDLATASPKKAAAPARQPASTPKAETIVAAKKRELAAQLAAEQGRT